MGPGNEAGGEDIAAAFVGSTEYGARMTTGLVESLGVMRERFAEAAAKLLLTMDCEHVRQITEDLTFVDPSNWGVLACVFVRIVLQHIVQGYPLALPPAVAIVYLAAGAQLETPFNECGDCGYCLPRSFRVCPLCGGRPGLGAHSLKQRRRAEWN